MINKQMEDFDRFTSDVAEGDPVKRAALEAGTLVHYWDAALQYVNRLLSAHKSAEAAKVNANRVTSRRGR